MLRTADPDLIRVQLEKVQPMLEPVNQVLLYVEGLSNQVAPGDGKQPSLLIEIRAYRRVGGEQVELLKTHGWDQAGS